jgi:hypothetical protein
MNPYYVVAFVSALFFWVWPGLIYNTLDAHWALVVAIAAAIFLLGGRAATEFDMRIIAPRKDLQQKKLLFAVTCITIVFVAALSRMVYFALQGKIG